MISCLKWIIGAVTMVVLVIGLYGCRSPQEERGYSPIPQNRPADWELRPFGDIRS